MDALPEKSRRVLIGKIVKVRGLRGDLKILPLTWRPERFEEFDSLLVVLPNGEINRYTIKRLRVENSMIFVRFQEVPRRDLAEELVGGEIYIDIDQRDELPEDMYYLDDLEGCKVVCSQFGDLGKITDIMDLPANNVWQVNGQYGEVLIPAIKEMVDDIDLVNKLIHVTLLDGLISQEQIDSVKNKDE